jgi:predicted RNA-binding Zn-ribbon protein involved in translation (DUF1610 family)
MITNRPDTCKSCNAHVPAQSLVSYRRGQGVYECPACRPGNIKRSIEAGNRALSIQELARLIEAARFGVWDEAALAVAMEMAPPDVKARAIAALAKIPGQAGVRP